MLPTTSYSIPMFSARRYLISNTKVKGLVMNPTQQGSTWNAETWTCHR